ncbi:DUF1990 family protein [Ornithinimicrobium avium]|uniref:DUF1990 family protein n=1 Tax=Ornithinimicrobium avium TaxID=2283195 RepID=UPI00192D1F4E|nr:DUF1990 family protein [Ornithinimicrobium avium]
MMSMLARWMVGTGLVSWRYLWMTTPLHRRLEVGDCNEDLPPTLPRELLDENSQLAGAGVGPLFHRTFTVAIMEPQNSAEELMAKIVGGFFRFVPREVVGVERDEVGDLVVGAEMVLKMPGPWDGPVRVVEVGPQSLRLATLQGHLEAGQVRFSAEPEGEDLVFTVETWARSATPSVQLLYSYLRLAKEIQLNMWVRFCLSAAKEAGGRPRDGVEVCTREVPEEFLRTEQAADGPKRLADSLVGPVHVFPFRFAEAYRSAAALFGVTPSTSMVTVTPEELIVRFGPWRLRTARSNIESVQRTGGFSWLRTAGPAHLSLADRGITFATNADDALCLTFREPVSAIEPTGRLLHPGMTVTVEDPVALMSLLG